MNILKTRKALIVGIVFIGSISFWAMFHVWTRTSAMDLGYQITKEQGIKEEFANDNKSLKLEISTLKRMDRLEAIASNELGMSPPAPEQVVHLWKKD
jgi:cell division protein FtsL